MSLPGESAILFSAESLKNPIDDIKNLFWHEEVFHIFGENLKAMMEI